MTSARSPSRAVAEPRIKARHWISLTASARKAQVGRRNFGAGRVESGQRTHLQGNIWSESFPLHPASSKADKNKSQSFLRAPDKLIYYANRPLSPPTLPSVDPVAARTP